LDWLGENAKWEESANGQPEALSAFWFLHIGLTPGLGPPKVHLNDVKTTPIKRRSIIPPGSYGGLAIGKWQPRKTVQIQGLQ